MSKYSIERAEYLYRDAKSEYLDLMSEEDDAMHDIISASITYRLALGPNAGRKALAPQAVPTCNSREKPSELVSKQADFSLYAGNVYSYKEYAKRPTRPDWKNLGVKSERPGNVSVIIALVLALYLVALIF